MPKHLTCTQDRQFHHVCLIIVIYSWTYASSRALLMRRKPADLWIVLASAEVAEVFSDKPFVQFHTAWVLFSVIKFLFFEDLCFEFAILYNVDLICFIALIVDTLVPNTLLRHERQN